MHRIAVERAWLERGEVIEVTLPRNLTCAACVGGGCDRCERSGAISIRARGEPEQTLTVPLPRRSPADIDRDPLVMLRIPGQGGFGPKGLDLPRGLLLLRVAAGASASDSRIPSSVPGPRISQRPVLREPAAVDASPSSRARRRLFIVGWVCLVLVVCWVVAVFGVSARLR